MAIPAQAYKLSAPALHAARTILRHFILVPRPECKIQPTEKNLGIAIDVCTQAFRAQNALNYLCSKVQWRDRNEAIAEIDNMREAIRAVELVKNSMPAYETEQAVPLWQKQRVEAEMTRGQAEEMRAISARLKAARTVDEEQAILRESVFAGQGER
jgi:hypothetical protein